MTADCPNRLQGERRGSKRDFTGGEECAQSDSGGVLSWTRQSWYLIEGMEWSLLAMLKSEDSPRNKFPYDTWTIVHWLRVTGKEVRGPLNGWAKVEKT